MNRTLILNTRPFDFRRLVFSHGWVFLAPFEWSDDRQVLSRPLRLQGGGSVRVRIKASANGESTKVNVSCQSTDAMNADDRQAIRDQVRRMIRLDEDYSEFHQLCAQDPLLAFVHKSRAGGLLRGASAFEDLVKTVCTTNCDWRNTKRMCQRLCELDPAGNFPSPEQILRVREARLAEQTSAGYRAKSFRQIARLTDDGKLPLDDWASQGDYERIESALKSIWGVGPYSRNHMMVLLGRYDAIPVDSEILKYLRATHFQGKPVAAKQAVEPYARYGRFQYLAFKFGRMARHENYINEGGGSPDYARAKRNGG